MLKINKLTPCAFFLRTSCEHILGHPQKVRRNPFSAPFSLKIKKSYSMSEVSFCRFETDKTDISDTCRFLNYRLTISYT